MFLTRVFLVTFLGCALLAGGCPPSAPPGDSNSGQSAVTDGNSGADGTNNGSNSGGGNNDNNNGGDSGNNGGSGDDGNGEDNGNDGDGPPPDNKITSTITGVIVLPDGQPLPNARVKVFPTRVVVFTDAAGRFQSEITAVRNTLTWAVSDNSVLSREHFGGSGQVALTTAKTDLGTIKVQPRVLATPLPGADASPDQLNVADFDGDGTLDVAAGGNIYLNYGAGTFESLHLPGTANGVTPAVVADLDGDGDTDIVTMTYQSEKKLRVFLNDGGHFSPAQEYSLDPPPAALAAGDIDGDGDVDIVVVRSYWPAIGVMRNNGDGTFTPPVFTDLERYPVVMRLADMDDDGDLDVVVVFSERGYNYHDGTLALLRNDGTGVFGAPELIDAGVLPGTAPYEYGYQFRLADFDADGDIDIATLARSTPEETSAAVSLVRNHGDGTFAAPEFFAASDNARNVAAGDIDGDGDIDLVVTAEHVIGYIPWTGNEEHLLPLYERIAMSFTNDGHGAFVAAAPQPYPGFDVAELADVDGDGGLDILCYAQDLGVTSIPTRGDGSFAAPQPFRTLPNIFAAQTGDLDGDGDVDLVVEVTDDPFANPPSLQFLRNNGHGNLTVDVQMINLEPIIFQFELQDMDGDGALDIVTLRYRGSAYGLLEVRRQRADGTFDDPQSYDIGGNPGEMRLADLDGDGDIDVVVRNAYGDVPLAVLFNNGDGTFAPRQGYFVRPDPDFIELADLDGDGDTDLLTRNNDGLWLLPNDGTGRFGTPVKLFDKFSDFILADVDHNGAVDFVTLKSNPGNYGFKEYVSVRKNLGNLQFAPPQDYLIGSAIYGAPHPFYGLQAGDLDGDGAPDLILGHLKIVRNDGTGGFGRLEDYALEPAVIALADFDGDGNLDIATVVKESWPTTFGGQGFVLRSQSVP